MEKAGIDQRGRDLSWYSIRHGVATVWAEDKGIYKAKNQMRHKSIETTLRYTRNSGDTLTKEVNSVW
jgi:integrase